MAFHKPVGDQVLYPELSYTLMQIVFEIHNKLGPGFTENIYQAAFVHELTRQQIAYEAQKPIRICYKGIVLGDYRLDLVVEQKIVVELKAVTALNGLFEQQLFSYLKAGHYCLGLLVNFGTRRVEHIRVVHSSYSRHS